MEAGEETRPVQEGKFRADLATEVIDPEKAFFCPFGALAKRAWQPVTRIVAENQLIWMPNPAQE